MKKIMIVSTLLLLLGASPAFAVDAHHPATDPAQAQAPAAGMAPQDQVATDKLMQEMDARIQLMQEMRQKMMEAMPPAERQKLRQEHLAEMRQGMKSMMGMGMMGGQGGMMGGQGGMMMGQQVMMMGKKMQMMQEMMQGLLDQQEMTIKGK